MAIAKFTVSCNICGYSEETSSEDAAYAKAAQHCAKVHGNTNQAHILGSHITVASATTVKE